MTDLGALGDRARALSKLEKTEGWKTLTEIYDEKRSTYASWVGRQSLVRGAELNQRELDFNAGWFAGIKSLLDKPEELEKRMEAALQKQRLQDEGTTSE